MNERFIRDGYELASYYLAGLRCTMHIIWIGVHVMVMNVCYDISVG